MKKNHLHHLVILGGGHAGSSAAFAAARARELFNKGQKLEITLINQTEFLGIRPRYYQYELEATQVKLSEYLKPIGVNLYVDKVQNINLSAGEILCNNRLVTYDSLILALGSSPNTLVPGSAEHCHDIDSYPAAKKFRDALEIHIVNKPHERCRIVILGGGITGLELACELPVTIQKIYSKLNLQAEYPEIVIMGRGKISDGLGIEPAKYINNALQFAKVTQVDNANIEKVEKNQVIYNNGMILAADFIVSTLGMSANHIIRNLEVEKDKLGRIIVNKYLQIPNRNNCFAVGDIAATEVAPDIVAPMSCQHGRPQGRYAGYNAAANLFACEMLEYSQPNYVTCIDLGAWGAVYTEGWERQVKLTGSDAKKLKRHINEERIYPPVDKTPEAILAAGMPEFIPPKETQANK